jgi:hypothetical protein
MSTEFIAAPDCYACPLFARFAQRFGMTSTCRCGATFHPDGEVVSLRISEGDGGTLVADPVLLERTRHPANPVTDLPCIARWWSSLFGRALGEACPVIVGLGGNGGSPTALQGRSDAVDESDSYSRAVVATGRMRALVRDGNGEYAAVLWMAYGANGGALLPDAQAARIAIGCAKEATRREWRYRTLANGKIIEQNGAEQFAAAVEWGREWVAPFWEGIAAVPAAIGYAIAVGFAPAEVRKCISRTMRSLEVISWGEARIQEATAAYQRAPAAGDARHANPRTRVSNGV